MFKHSTITLSLPCFDRCGLVGERRAARHYDWRYYLVRYDWMREGRCGVYYGADRRLGYQMTMRDKTVQRLEVTLPQ